MFIEKKNGLLRRSVSFIFYVIRSKKGTTHTHTQTNNFRHKYINVSGHFSNVNYAITMVYLFYIAIVHTQCCPAAAMSLLLSSRSHTHTPNTHQSSVFTLTLALALLCVFLLLSALKFTTA